SCASARNSSMRFCATARISSSSRHSGSRIPTWPLLLSTRMSSPSGQQSSNHHPCCKRDADGLVWVLSNHRIGRPDPLLCFLFQLAAGLFCCRETLTQTL